MMDRLSQDCPVALAVSRTRPTTLRDELVPLNKKYPLKELLAACERYLAHAPRDFITLNTACWTASMTPTSTPRN